MQTESTWPATTPSLPPKGASSSVGELAGDGSFYALEEIYGAGRYRSPFYCKIFSKGGREAYLDALQDRYLAILDYLFFEKETRPFRREIFMLELEDLIGELRALKVSPGHLKGFLDTKGSPGDPVHERILSFIDGAGEMGESVGYFPGKFLFRATATVALVILAFYIHFRFVLQA